MKLFIFLPKVDLDSTKKDVIVLPDLKRSVRRTIKNKHREEEEEDLYGNVRKMIVTLRCNICIQEHVFCF
jgi:hypothetical protein